MSYKTTKILLGNLNGKDVYAIGPYAEDIRAIMALQTKQISDLRKEISLLKSESSSEGMGGGRR